MDPALLALFTALLGEDHPVVLALTDAEPNAEATYEGASEAETAALAAFANVTDENIAEAVAALRALGRSDETPTDDVIAAADLVQGLAYIQDVRAEAAAIEQEARDAATALLGDDPEPEPEADPDAEPVDPDAEVTPEPEADPANAPEPVAASRPRIGQVAPRVPKPSRPLPSDDAQLQANADAVALRLVDGINGNFERGEIVDDATLASALAAKWGQFSGRPVGGFEKHTVASAKWLDQYPADQMLKAGEYEHNQAAIQAAVGGYRAETPEALTAAICAPPTPVYDIVTLGTEDRPVKSFLPNFGATRGGIIFRPGLPLSSAGTIGADSSGVTVNWIDGDESKFVLSVTCPATDTQTVEAFVARAEVSNMQSQYDPESVAAALRLQMVLWARGTETSLLNKILANSDDIGADNATDVGFTRLLLERYNSAATGIRSHQRMARDATLDLLLPFWVVNAVMDDMSFQQPGDGLVTLDATAGWLEQRFAVRDIRVGWFLDQQLMLPQTVPSADLAGYPQQVTGYLFDPGHHLFLDGGELNLGIVRDSTLNDSNEYQTFQETFEGLASRGVVSYAIEINVCRSGTTGAGVEIPCGGIS